MGVIFELYCVSKITFKKYAIYFESIICLPAMEASAARAQSGIKRPRVALNGRLFKSAIDAIQGQNMTPPPSLDPQRKIDRPSCRIDQTGRGQLDDQQVRVETSCSSDTSSTKTLKKARYERARDQESVHNSRCVSFHMSQCVKTSEWMDWKTQFRQTTESASVPYIDSHCHLDLLFRRAGFTGTFKKYQNEQTDTFPSNFFGCITIFCQPLIWNSYLAKESLFNLLLSEDNIWAAVGCHPKSAMCFDAHAEINLKTLLKHERVKALGEVGLDYSGNYAQYRDMQIDVLQRQVTTAVKLNKPLVIHAREAEHEIVKVLEKIVPKNYKIHRHCFLGSWGEAEAWLLKFPCSYIGLTPAVTHSKHHPGLRDLMWHLPLDKLLLETDAPYFIPSQIPFGEMPFSHPGLAITVAIEVARIKQLPVNDVLSACLRNTREMYNL